MTTLVAVLAAMLGMHPVPESDLHADGGFFRDANNRVVVLRGVNMAGNAKLPPFTPITDGAMFDKLPELGFNAVRLLFTWEAFEPRPGEYNEAYLAYYAQAVEWAWEHGIYTIVDFHQDALSRFLVHGCGEGFPEWAVPAYVKHHRPKNDWRCAKWPAMIWVDIDLHRTWNALYRDENGVLARYAAMAQTVAARFAHTPGVIGYDIINEPMGDEETEIGPFHEEIAAAIHSVHPEALLFVEPNLRADIGIQTRLPKPSFPNIVYAPHFYDALTAATNIYLGGSMTGPFNTMLSKAREWGVPLFVAEFGASPSTRNALGYIRTLYDRFDDNFISGAQWSYTPGWSPVAKDGWNVEDLSIIDDKGAMRANYTPRPYAQKIAGTPLTLKVTEPKANAQATVAFTWMHDVNAGKTEVFVPSNFFPGGVSLHPEGDGLTCDHDGVHTVACTATTGGIKTLRISGRN